MFAHLRMNSSCSIDPTQPLYENLEQGEIKSVLLRGRYSKPDIFANVDLPLDTPEPCTLSAARGKVNYIVLDLDLSQNTSTATTVTSPTTTGGGSLTANNKTFALSNSTTPSSELDSEGSRKTRHNFTVTPLIRQSNSVSD